mgnify:CR=1 FL=1
MEVFLVDGVFDLLGSTIGFRENASRIELFSLIRPLLIIQESLFVLSNSVTHVRTAIVFSDP